MYSSHNDDKPFHILIYILYLHLRLFHMILHLRLFLSWIATLKAIYIFKSSHVAPKSADKL